MNKQVCPIRVLVVDDHEMLRKGLHAFIGSYDDLELVGEAASGLEAVQKCLELKPDAVLMDLVMPEMDGLTAIKIIHAAQPDIKIIVLSGFSDEYQVREALRSGATSYLLKNIPAARLADAIRTAAAGLPTLSPEITRIIIKETLVSRKPDFGLTRREGEVLDLMVKGHSNSKISEILCISLYTVKNHVSSILLKMGVSSRTEAVGFALKNNLVQ
jgi:NarL family two-component system response regulator LiaR